MTESLEFLIYRSAALIDRASPEMKRILASSRRRNAEWRITGFLLFETGAFLQYLEGPKEPLQRLLEIIMLDARHANLRVTHRGTLERRQCAHWSMAMLSSGDRYMIYDGRDYDPAGYALDLPFNPYTEAHVIPTSRFEGHVRDPSDPRLNRRERML